MSSVLTSTTVEDTRWYASPRDRAALEQVYSVRCVDHDDWFYRRESAAPKDISRRDRRDGWTIKFCSTWKIDLDEIPHEFTDQLLVCIVNFFSLSHSMEEWTRSFASCRSYGVRLQSGGSRPTRDRRRDLAWIHSLHCDRTYRRRFRRVRTFFTETFSSAVHFSWLNVNIQFSHERF